MKQLLLLCCVAASFFSYSQELTSFSNSNYSGINGADLNPSFPAYSRLKTDISFLQVKTTFFNNNFYANPQFVPGMAFRKEVPGYINNAQHANYEVGENVVLQHDITDDATNLFANAIIKGPGFMTSDGFKAIAVQTHFKTLVDVNNVDPQLSRMLFEQTGYKPYFNKGFSIQNGSGISMMSYGEVSFTYAKMLTNRRDRIINIGVTGKLLLGFNALYLISRGSDISFKSQNELNARNMNMDFGYAMPDYTRVGEGTFTPKGFGAGADIGFSYLRKKNSRLYKIGCPSFIRKVCFMPNYKWKFGISILDVGGISYKSLANAYEYRNVALNWDTLSATKAKTIQEADKLIQARTAGKGSIEQSYGFYMALPTALSIQYDYNIDDAFYINATLVQRLSLTDGPQVRRMNVMTIAPRIETDQVEVSVPVSIYEYAYPALGLMARYRGFFIGSDQLGSTFGFTRLNGADLYVGVKMTLNSDHSPAAASARKRRRANNLN